MGDSGGARCGVANPDTCVAGNGTGSVTEICSVSLGLSTGVIGVGESVASCRGVPCLDACETDTGVGDFVGTCWGVTPLGSSGVGVKVGGLAGAGCGETSFDTSGICAGVGDFEGTFCGKYSCGVFDVSRSDGSLCSGAGDPTGCSKLGV